MSGLDEEDEMSTDDIWVSCQSKGQRVLAKHQAKVGRYAFKETGKKMGVVASMMAYDVGPEIIERGGHEAVAHSPEAVDYLQNFFL